MLCQQHRQSHVLRVVQQNLPQHLQDDPDVPVGPQEAQQAPVSAETVCRLSEKRPLVVSRQRTMTVSVVRASLMLQSREVEQI